MLKQNDYNKSLKSKCYQVVRDVMSKLLGTSGDVSSHLHGNLCFATYI